MLTEGRAIGSFRSGTNLVTVNRNPRICKSVREGAAYLSKADNLFFTPAGVNTPATYEVERHWPSGDATVRVCNPGRFVLSSIVRVAVGATTIVLIVDGGRLTHRFRPTDDHSLM